MICTIVAPINKDLFLCLFYHWPILLTNFSGKTELSCFTKPYNWDFEISFFVNVQFISYVPSTIKVTLHSWQINEHSWSIITIKSLKLYANCKVSTRLRQNFVPFFCLLAFLSLAVSNGLKTIFVRKDNAEVNQPF